MPANIDLNTASPEDLVTLPGIGAALADRIVADREAVGRFNTVDDLRRISGVSARVLDGIRDRVTVEPGRGEDARPRRRAGDKGGGTNGGDDERYEPGKHHGGDPVLIHEDYIRQHLEGGGAATPEAYERAREQFGRLPGAVQRPPTEVRPDRPPRDNESGETEGAAE